MKKITAVIGFMLSVCTLSAQDIITKRDGSDIYAKVTEVKQTEVTYKKHTNPDGPTYTIDISEILMITYSNGEREVYAAPNAQVNKKSLPQGIMSYNSWTGKAYIDNIPLEDGVLKKVFTEHDYNRYKKGKTAALVGGIIGIVGAIPFGACVGSLIAGGDADPALLAASGVAFVGGLIVNLIGEGSMRKAVNSYNSTFAFQPQVKFSTSTNGIGLALVF